MLGGVFLADGLGQLAEWGAEFAAHPETSYWLQSPSSHGTPALLGMGVMPDIARSYMEHIRMEDPMWHAAEALSAQRGSASWVVTDTTAQHARGFRSTSIYNEFLRPYEVGARLLGGGRGSSRPVGKLFMSICRRSGVAGFSRDEVARFQGEFESVQRTAYLHREMTALRTRTRGLEALMEQMPMGMLFFDTAGRLLHANVRARILCARPESSALRSLQRGALLASTADPLLRSLFRQSLQGRSGCAELPGGLVLVTLSLADLAALGVPHQAPGVAWVVMERSLDCAAAVALAHQAYRLSPSEAALLLALMRGRTPQNFADARGSRISTVRTQMSALLAKTGTQRQQDLVALVARWMLLTPAEASAAPAPLP